MSGLKSQYSPDTMFLSRGNESRPWYLLRWRQKKGMGAGGWGWGQREGKTLMVLCVSQSHLLSEGVRIPVGIHGQ